MTEKAVLGRDFEVEINIIPLNEEFEPVLERSITRSATCVTDLDTLIGRGSDFLQQLPLADNHTSWK